MSESLWIIPALTLILAFLVAVFAGGAVFERIRERARNRKTEGGVK